MPNHIESLMLLTVALVVIVALVYLLAGVINFPRTHRTPAKVVAERIAREEVMKARQDAAYAALENPLYKRKSYDDSFNTNIRARIARATGKKPGLRRTGT